MDLRAYLRAIRVSWWLILLMTVVGGLGAAAELSRQTPVYAGYVTFFVAAPGATDQGSLSSNLTAAEDLAVSYARLLSSDRLAQAVADADPAIGLKPGQIAARISGSTELNTVLVNAKVQDTSPPRLKRITRAVAQQFPQLVNELNSPTSQVTLKVTSGPGVGAAPVSPNKKLELGIGLVAGLLLGLGLAVGRYLLDTKVRSADTVQELTGQPVIGNIAYDPRAKHAPLLDTSSLHSIRAEAYRQLRTNLQFIDAAAPANVIVVSSPLPGEGKSTTAANLALVFADLGRSVLLVEADLRRPRVADYFGLERVVGLTNVLTYELDLEDVVQKWGDTSLSVLPSGGPPPNPSELLGSPRMADLLARLRAEYDIVILDTPPLLPVTDAAVIGRQSDGVILVARHARTRRNQLATAASNLEAVDARLLGVVLNMTPRLRVGRYGYRGYAPLTGEAFRGGGRHESEDGDVQQETVTPPADAPTEKATRPVDEDAPVDAYDDDAYDEDAVAVDRARTAGAARRNGSTGGGSNGAAAGSTARGGSSRRRGPAGR